MGNTIHERGKFLNNGINVINYVKSKNITIVYIKGFTNGINYDEIPRDLLFHTHLLIKQLTTNKHILFCWDGDVYDKDSYTNIIKKLMLSSNKNYYFLTFQKGNDLKELKESWKDILSITGRTIYYVPLLEKHDKLRNILLTETRHIVCLGADDNLSKVFYKCKDKNLDINWYILNYYKIEDGKKEYNSIINIRGLSKTINTKSGIYSKTKIIKL